jgi:predicted RNA-binding protein YlqC (UPF0109 family)
VEKDLIEYIAKSLVDNADAVQVNVVEEEETTIVELRVGDGDIGKVIGKHGRIVKAIRTILQAASVGKSGKRAVLEVLE